MHNKPCSRWKVLRFTRSVCVLAISIGVCAGSDVAQAATPSPNSAWSFNLLRERARKVAQTEYQPETPAKLPEFFEKLGYDDYQKITFRAELAPWHDDHLPFQVEMMHRGYLFKDAVRIFLLEGRHPREFIFQPQQFNYDGLRLEQPPPDGLAFAGFRVVTQSAQSNPTEFASFLGASYFRLAGIEQPYGASARGLTIDTAEPSGEEFPRFTEFWIEKPAESAEFLQLFALLDSPSATGAFRFLIRPGSQTLAEIDACYFPRQPERKIGLAPLTSMFLVGENRTRFIPDFRPEVHDSDGLLVQPVSGETIWRPLANPDKKHRVTTFQIDDLAGFGLLQRDRSFQNYQDLTARYHRRPSLWVKPLNQWGPGQVELVEIPTSTEYNDNIVAYWIPDTKAAKGQEYRFTYSLAALAGEPETEPLLRVQSTRITPPVDKKPPRLVIDFSGASLAAPSGLGPLEASVTTTAGEIKNLVAQKNEVTGGWRVFFDLENAPEQGAELRLSLKYKGKIVSETWAYRYGS